jgi:hypothetical protein
MDKLIQLLNQLNDKIKFGEIKNENISDSTVLWQINHSFMVVNEVSKAIALSNPNEYQWKFNKTRFLVFILGKIPRGKAKAPQKSKPKENFDVESTKLLFDETITNLLKINDLEKNKYFQHPIFGKINKKSTLKFLFIHTKHHFKIVEDILAH